MEWVSCSLWDSMAEGRCPHGQHSSARNGELSVASKFGVGLGHVEWRGRWGEPASRCSRWKRGVPYIRGHSDHSLHPHLDPLKPLQRGQSWFPQPEAFCQENFQEIGINSDSAAVLNLTPWVWCELGRCPSHRHILLTLVNLSFKAQV